MTFAQQMVLDGQYITHAEMTETIVYAGNTINCVVDGELVEQMELENGDGEGQIIHYSINITDNSDSTNYPGVANPQYGDAVTVRTKSGFVTSVDRGELNGTHLIVVQVVEEVSRGPNNTVYRK